MSGGRAAVVLLSGGMDSATTLALARAEGWVVHALTVDYGQRHRAELDRARRLAEALGAATFRLLRVDLGALGGSALTADVEVPKDRPEAEIGSGVPATYVPARNTILLGVALAAAEALDADAVFLGVNAVDTSGYPDCRPDFLDAFRAVSSTGTRRGAEGRPIGIRAPLLADTKGAIVRRAVALGVPLALTLSCYEPVTRGGEILHCGRCDACRLRARGFAEAGLEDPAPRA
jgi:7-cyano-7-deazaguanine synthase